MGSAGGQPQGQQQNQRKGMGMSLQEMEDRQRAMLVLEKQSEENARINRQKQEQEQKRLEMERQKQQQQQQAQQQAQQKPAWGGAKPADIANEGRSLADIQKEEVELDKQRKANAPAAPVGGQGGLLGTPWGTGAPQTPSRTTGETCIGLLSCSHGARAS